MSAIPPTRYLRSKVLNLIYNEVKIWSLAYFYQSAPCHSSDKFTHLQVLEAQLDLSAWKSEMKKSEGMKVSFDPENQSVLFGEREKNSVFGFFWDKISARCFLDPHSKAWQKKQEHCRRQELTKGQKICKNGKKKFTSTHTHHILYLLLSLHK